MKQLALAVSEQDLVHILDCVTVYEYDFHEISSAYYECRVYCANHIAKWVFWQWFKIILMLPILSIIISPMRKKQSDIHLGRLVDNLKGWGSVGVQRHVLWLTSLNCLSQGCPILSAKGLCVQVFILIKKETHLINQLILAFNSLSCGFCFAGMKTCNHTGSLWIRLNTPGL